MTGLETTALVRAVHEITLPHQKGFLQYILISWFGNHYKKYLKDKIIIEHTSKMEAQIQIMDNIAQNPSQALSLIESEAEIDYKNLASVLMKTAEKINPNAKGNIDPDKIKRLKDLSKEFSSEEMQDCISSILAEEYNSPGAFSLQTMDIVRTMSKNELEIFSKFKQIIISREYTFSNIFSSVEHMKNLGISIDDLSIIESLGLISLSELSKTLPYISEGQRFSFEICGKLLYLKYNGNKDLNGLYSLTRAGKELYPLINTQILDSCFEYMTQLFIEQGFTI